MGRGSKRLFLWLLRSGSSIVSVLSDEIRKLTETSTQQSKTIGNQLTEIQPSISDVVLALEMANSIGEIGGQIDQFKV